MWFGRCIRCSCLRSANRRVRCPRRQSTRSGSLIQVSSRRDVSQAYLPRSKPSTLSSINRWVKAFEFDACIICRGPPMDRHVLVATLCRPCGCFMGQTHLARYATVEALSIECTQLNLSHVEASMMFGSPVKLQSVQDAFRFSRCKERPRRGLQTNGYSIDAPRRK